MPFDLLLLYTYRLMAAVVAIMMIWVLFRERDWRSQFFAMLVFVPFALRAAGVK